MTVGEGGRGAFLTRTWSDGEAAMVRQLLGQHGIPCRVVCGVPQSIASSSVDEAEIVEASEDSRS